MYVYTSLSLSIYIYIYILQYVYIYIYIHIYSITYIIHNSRRRGPTGIFHLRRRETTDRALPDESERRASQATSLLGRIPLSDPLWGTAIPVRRTHATSCCKTRDAMR